MSGRRQPARDGRVYITLRLDPEIVARLDEEAEERAVSRTYLVERAVEDWLEANAVS
jgi:predicted transcriptional regulator